jgi:hypothetical protein
MALIPLSTSNSIDSPLARFRELIVYVAQLSESDDKFGATKLNKLLFYIDFMAYRHFGKSITTQRYQKLPNGPAPRAVVPILNKLEAEKAVVTQQMQHFNKTQKRTIALRDPDLDVFSPREIDLINFVVRKFANHNATEISDQSHKFAGWILADVGEDIPYEVSLAGHREPSPAEINHAIELQGAAGQLIANA